jgi:2-oxo-4-hydroxy-4-carboxy--5-ureidoimidazoline (OHCU) decarboxylase
MGEESITTGRPIDAIIEEKKKTGMEYLTDKEFEAIIELNRGLRF